jgi:transposase
MSKIRLPGSMSAIDIRLGDQLWKLHTVDGQAVRALAERFQMHTATIGKYLRERRRREKQADGPEVKPSPDARRWYPPQEVK